MKILMINKFLHPNGGSETYIFKLGEVLKARGHEVQYFGMEHEGRCVGNAVNAYTSDMDFHGGGRLSKLTYPIKTIYSSEARKKIRIVLEDFEPDVCHLNNFNYQLTPSIILEIKKWERETKHKVRIVATAHDYQLICPNHQLNNPNTHENCEKCLGGSYINCIKGKCIHGSTAKSIIGTLEASFWKAKGVYKHIDIIICCSNFLKTKMDTNPVFAGKTVAIHNFTERTVWREVEKEDYCLYFGRYSEEKGVKVLIEACKKLPEIKFIFAGSGPFEEDVNKVHNITNVGFKTGSELDDLIRKARFSICPSVVHENCPFSVMESQERGTPVVGAKVGGVPELIEDGVNGRLFESGNVDALAELIRELWHNPELVNFYREHCRNLNRDDLKKYGMKLEKLYAGYMG
ncbi:MAG: glycosyltransferase family 4 protein [Lachnospiraceae bacterium]|nr:glycosyltransferase family 4 protein [Lachnospiraceae bacterium]